MRKLKYVLTAAAAFGLVFFLYRNPDLFFNEVSLKRAEPKAVEIKVMGEEGQVAYEARTEDPARVRAVVGAVRQGILDVSSECCSPAGTLTVFYDGGAADVITLRVAHDPEVYEFGYDRKHFVTDHNEFMQALKGAGFDVSWLESAEEAGHQH